MSAVVGVPERQTPNSPTPEPEFVRHFELIAGSPGGVPRLRELILSLAVQGKLLPQDPNDEPAGDLLRRIHSAKRCVKASGQIRSDKDLPPIDEEEIGFKIPPSWCWVRLGEITNYGSPTKAGAIHADSWVLDLEDIEKGSGRLLNRVRHSDRPSISEKNAFNTGDVLYGKLRPYLNKVLVADEPGVCSSELVPFRCHGDWDPGYFKLALSSPMFLRYVNARSYGMKMPRLGTDDARRSVLPLPPLQEQARIVARVDELMRLCDDLEAKGRLEAERQARLLETLLGTLTESTTAKELSANWKRVAEHFDQLFDRVEAVDALEKALLQLAVRGLLVPQDPNDEPASLLLRRIRSDKERLMIEGRIKRDKPLPSLDAGEAPFELPTGWSWVRLGSIAGVERGGSPRPIEAFLTDSPEGLNWIKIGDTEKGGKYITSTREKIRPEGLSKTRKVYPGDFLLTNSMSFGRPYISQIEGCIHDGWLRISPPSSLDKDYLYLLLSSSFMRELFIAAAAGGVVQNLNADKVRGVPIPMPPLAEQARIVTRAAELRRLCADLRKRLERRSVSQAALADALIDQALAA